MKRLVVIFFSALVLILGFMVYRYSTFCKPPTIEVEFAGEFELPDVDETWVGNSLSEAIQFKTIRPESEEEFEKFVMYLEKRFPLFHKKLERNSINNDGAFLFEWTSKDIPKGERPVLLCAHYDVVPIVDEEAWTYPPFSGKIVDGMVWGRGAVDDKNNVIAMMSSVEMLIKDGFEPLNRPFLFAFGLDEELGGDEGASQISSYLQENDIHPIFAHDEGGLISSNIMKNLGVTKDIAFVGLSEKTTMNIEVTVTLNEEAHASMPGITVESMSTSYISDILTRVVKKQMKSHSRGILMNLFLRSLTPHVSFMYRCILSLTSLSQTIMDLMFTGEKKQNAMIRTGVSPTYVHSGYPDAKHVFSNEGFALLQVHVHPENTLEEVEEYYRNLINPNDDPRIEMKISGFPPVSISEYNSLQYSVLQKTIEGVFGGREKIGVVPILYIAGSDLKHYHSVTPYAYNFMPFVFDEEEGDFKLFHGVDERVSIKQMVKGTQFYYALIKNLDSVESF